ncbi:MAG: hypothetical protein CM1200mP22_09080 [Dehalococcoidia bacterium]|jgi:uncharacterized protein (DUF1501 family)|nr:DUF1501 domain-containing protein [Dehalococcoidia bacterium]MEE2948578.1 DUF1501 domain-containing protein [Chloroflexota bacterium]GIS93671.1 MAG: hypothetical protein CM1200mP22_09080 [Dehalococcoidia bacterium]|tara:strand:+ start:5570 stop:6706 length:1137 start_codon:yes stop_codon:yes gene_type:complete
MVSTVKDPVLAVMSLSGGNDGLNTVIPYNNSKYRDYRPSLSIASESIIPINDQLGLHPAMAPLKKYWDEGHLAIIVGVGYPNGSLSHFRSMDIWATCEPDELGLTGWLGSVIHDVDPRGENVLTGVNFGRGLPRSLAKEGVAVASVGDLSTYGLLTDMGIEDQRAEALDLFGRMYAPAIGQGAVDDYIRRTGIEALQGADILSAAPGLYTSDVEYASTAMGGYLRDMAQVHNADFGTRVMFTTAPYNIFDTHANQSVGHANLLQDVSVNVDAFITDLRQLGKSDNLTLFFYSEFGRRAMDNGSGTDHGTGGVAFAIGDHVKGGIYGEYPSLEEGKLEDGGNLQHNVDFRSPYTTLLDRWMGLDAKSIVGGDFETLDFI